VKHQYIYGEKALFIFDINNVENMSGVNFLKTTQSC